MNLVALERAALKSLMLLPRPVLSRLAAGMETRGRDHLDPHIRLLLALSAAKPALNTVPVAQARKLYQDMIALLDVAERPMPVVVDHQVPVADDTAVLVRRYRPENAPRLAPAILYFHGGGLTVAGRKNMTGSAAIAERTNTVVLSVAIASRNIPRPPVPMIPRRVALAAGQHRRPGAGSQRLVVMGDSAGGNLSAVVCQQVSWRGWRCRRCGAHLSDHGRALEHESRRPWGGFGLDLPLLTWFRSHFIPDPVMMADYRVSPLRNPELDGHPCDCDHATDPLRDEGLEQAKLRAAGVDVTSLDFPNWCTVSSAWAAPSGGARRWTRFVRR